MSFDATAWAWQQPCESGLQKLVLLALADCRNQITGQCNPSHATLASKCATSVATIKRTITALEHAGLLTIRHASKEGCKTSNHYTLAYKPIRVNVTPIDRRLGSHSTHNRVNQHNNRVRVSYGVGSQRAINQEVEPGKEPVIEPERSEVSEEVKQQRLVMLQNLKQTIASKSLQTAITSADLDP